MKFVLEEKELDLFRSTLQAVIQPILKKELSTVLSDLQSSEKSHFVNIFQASRLLHLSIHTVRKKVRLGEIPGYKQGNKWVFKESELIDFITANRSNSHIDSLKTSDDWVNSFLENGS